MIHNKCIKKKIIAGIYLGIVQLSLQAELPLDLEQKAQNFVLETKQIKIPGFPGAFNPSITRWRNSLLMCFRVRNSKMVSTFEMGFVWLDKHFNPISTPRILTIHNNTSSFYKNQDPRIITLNEHLYIIYSNFTKIDKVITRRMFIAPVQYENDSFFITKPLCLDPFEGSGKRWEKNWVPFNYNGNILLGYSILPHRILTYSDSGTCKTISSTRSSINWDWGHLRGGTPASIVDDEYLGFFHSSKKLTTVHSNGIHMPHYVMGAYTFSTSPPFKITRISPEPIIGKKFYNGPAYNTWKPLRVVFPGGYVFDKQYIWVVYGRQDFEIWVVKLDKEGLFKSLIPCSKELESNYEYDDHSKYLEGETDHQNNYFVEHTYENSST